MLSDQFPKKKKGNIFFGYLLACLGTALAFIVAGMVFFVVIAFDAEVLPGSLFVLSILGFFWLSWINYKWFKK